MKIVFGADHRGFHLKNEIKGSLKSPHSVFDVGAHDLNPQDDYPQFAKMVAEEVVKDPESRGIVFCGSGVGVEIVANKFDGIRAGIGISVEQVAAARRDDDMNVLVIAADFIDPSVAQQMVQTFLSTSFEPSESHTRRLNSIKIIEETN